MIMPFINFFWRPWWTADDEIKLQKQMQEIKIEDLARTTIKFAEISEKYNKASVDFEDKIKKAGLWKDYLDFRVIAQEMNFINTTKESLTTHL